jgi:Xaa-Pro aminopeptidase
MADGAIDGAIFPAAEHRRRVAALQRGMAAAGLDALLLTTPPDVFYVTGFLTRFWESPTRPWFVVVPAEGPPVAVIPAIGAAPMGRTWIDDIRTWDAPEPGDDGVSLLAETLADRVPEAGRIGVPMGAETHLRMPPRSIASARAARRPTRPSPACRTSPAAGGRRRRCSGASRWRCSRPGRTG